MFDNRGLRRLILPLIVEQLLAMLVGMAATIMVSHAGEEAISGVSLVNMVNTLVITLLTALGAGGTVVVSQYLGHGDKKGANAAASQLTTISLVFSLALTAVCLAFHRGILRLLYGAVEPGVMEAAVTYFVITAFSIPFLGMHASSASLYRAMGRTNSAMYVSLLMNAVNIAGNAIGVYALKAGVAGVAYPTLISWAVAGTVMTRMAFRPENEVRLSWKRILKWNREMAGRILGVALPNAVENGLFTFGRVLVTSIVAAFGTMQIAANGVSQSVNTIAIVVVNAMNVAALAVVGRAVGARDYDGAAAQLRKLMRLSYLATLLMSLLVWALLPVLRGFFKVSEDTWRLSWQLILAHNAMATLLHPTSFTLPNGLRAAGDVRFTMVAGIVSMLVFRLGTAYLLGMGLGLGIWGVWAAMGVDWLGRSALFTWRFRSGCWKDFRVI